MPPSQYLLPKRRAGQLHRQIRRPVMLVDHRVHLDDLKAEQPPVIRQDLHRQVRLLVRRAPRTGVPTPGASSGSIQSISSGTPITRIRRVGSVCVPLCENDEAAMETSEGFDIQTAPCGVLWPTPHAAQTHLRPRKTGRIGVHRQSGAGKMRPSAPKGSLSQMYMRVKLVHSEFQRIPLARWRPDGLSCWSG